MLKACRELVMLTETVSLAQLLQDRLRCLAMEKLFINLGEAARRVDPGCASETRDIPQVADSLSRWLNQRAPG